MERTHDERCRLTHSLFSLPPSSSSLSFAPSLSFSPSLCLSLPVSFSLPPSFSFFLHSQDSPIIDFYPTDFKVDLNGKKWAWQGVALLPFVDEQRLLQALSFVYPNLTAYEGQSITSLVLYVANYIYMQRS